MVSSKAKTVSIVFRAELTAVDEPAACHSPKREPRPIPKGGVSGTLVGVPRAMDTRAPLRKHVGAPRGFPG
jgi:hypothetical protein